MSVTSQRILTAAKTNFAIKTLTVFTSIKFIPPNDRGFSVALLTEGNGQNYFSKVFLPF